ncbi:hypothetical protein SRB5_18620 [Streptomyces sp. RB5]|uniref:DUF305 domain-containing protein n=1 Tax=Streptomyces smaragdinus TaxID=2585196 RepID=A0A7K0CEH3_9ACTN|nr:DUF305 domain-containing protein [Streptomyces smaragdinus]MQY11743.1 hypothetical protein [Streptomyces smaragdinus]
MSYLRPLAALAAVVALALTGCTGGSGDSGGSGDGKADGPAVLQPGRPGEDNKSLTPEEARAAQHNDTPNAADYLYVRMMIQHHRQALVMTDLAAEHTPGDKVGTLASRIAAAQKPEIRAMEDWLKQNDGEHHGGGHSGHGAMPGMATAAQLDELRGARGEAFDDLFLKLMIRHHEGAITMATDVLSEGNNVLVGEMANDVVATQTVEISRMRTLR